MTVTRPRPVYCVNEHEHRDRELAEAVAAGRFSFAGETRDLGLEPDWLHADLPGRRGVADRLGQVLLRARPRRRVPRHRRPPLPRRVGAARRQLRAPGPARPRLERRHRPPDPELDLRVAAAAGGGRGRARGEHRRAGAARAREPHRRAQPPHARALRAADRRARAARAGDRAAGRGTARQPADRLRARRRPPRALHALPLHRAALVRRRARELPPLRRRAARRLRRAAGARVRVRARLPPPRRHDPGALGQRHRRLHELLDLAGRLLSRDDLLDGRSEHVRRRRLRDPARRRPLPDPRLRPARRRRPRPLRRAQRRGVGGRQRARDGPRPLHVRRGRTEPAPLVPRHRGAQHRLRRRRRSDAVRARALVAPVGRGAPAQSERRRTRRPRSAAPSTRRSTAAAWSSSAAATG